MAKRLARWFADLCKGVAHHNHDGELEQLCSKLGVDYQQFDGMSPDDISLEVGGAMLFRNDIGKLLDYLRKNRPRVQPFSFRELNWDKIGDQAKLSISIGDPLLAFLDNQPITVPKAGSAKLWYHELVQALTNYYDDDEFRKMCIAFQINFERLSGMKRKARTEEVVRIAISANGVGRLVGYCRQNRPRVQPMSNHSIPWDDIVARAAAAIKEENPLHDPILAKRIRKKH